MFAGPQLRSSESFRHSQLELHLPRMRKILAERERFQLLNLSSRLQQFCTGPEPGKSQRLKGAIATELRSAKQL